MFHLPQWQFIASFYLNSIDQISICFLVCAYYMYKSTFIVCKAPIIDFSFSHMEIHPIPSQTS